MSRLKIKKTSRTKAEKWRNSIADVLTTTLSARTRRGEPKHPWLRVKFKNYREAEWREYDRKGDRTGYVVRAIKDPRDPACFTWAVHASLRDVGAHGLVEMAIWLHRAAVSDFVIAATAVRFMREVEHSLADGDLDPDAFDLVDEFEDNWEPTKSGQQRHIQRLNIDGALSVGSST